MAKINQILQASLIALIRIYQAMISPFLGQCCRFSPTCSKYACIAIKKYGIITGLFLTIRRVFRCHPWHHGGYDPVP